MKFFKLLLFVILGLLGIIAILVIVAPKDFTVKESITIDAPKSVVFKHIQNLKMQHAWNPWNELDPDQVVTFSEGEDGVPGYKYEWSGPVNGNGFQQLVSVDENTVVQDLVFTAPYESKSKVTFEVEETEEGTKVTWTMEGSMPIPMNAVLMFSDMGMSNDFQRGLKNLEMMVSDFVSMPVYRGNEVKVVDIEPTRFLGIRENISMEDMQDFYASSYESLYGKLSKYDIGRASGLYYVWDEETGTTDMVATLVASKDVPALEFFELEMSGKALQVELIGDYKGLADAHWAIDDYMTDFGISIKEPVWEEYLVGPDEEADTSKWITKVTYFIE